MASFEMTFEGVFGGPCPVCDQSGELLAHSGEYGSYVTIRHMDGSGHERVCTMPEGEGILYTSGGRWHYVPREFAVTAT